MSVDFVTSDVHFLHANIIKYCNRPFSSVEEQTEYLIENWNRVVGKDHVVMNLGDFIWTKDPDAWVGIVNRLNGKQQIVVGNHDHLLTEKDGTPKNYADLAPQIQELIKTGKIISIKSMCEIKLAGRWFHYVHFPLGAWHRSLYGSAMIHGHCVDEETEIMTTSGWRGIRNIAIGDGIYSFDPSRCEFVLDTISQIVKQNYHGDVYELDTRNISFRVTSEHTMVHFSRGGKFLESPASVLLKQNTMGLLKAGVRSGTRLNLSDDLLALLILIAADGSIKTETQLARIKVKRPHKIAYIKQVLCNLQLQYSKYKQKDASWSFNFYIPPELLSFTIKGLDRKLMSCSPDQFKVILGAYANSDGSVNGNGVIIYSAKEAEIDLLQELAVISGFSATKFTRRHGFSGGLRHQLSVYPNAISRVQSIRSKLKVERVYGELFWCIKCKNQNFIMRRNGKVHLTGNSHGKYRLSWPQSVTDGKAMDAGVDSRSIATNTLDDKGLYRPFCMRTEVAPLIASIKSRNQNDFNGDA